MGRRRSPHCPHHRLLAGHPSHGRGRTMMLPRLLTSLILFPTVGALALLCLRGDDHKFSKGLALGVSVCQFGFALRMLKKMDFSASGYQLEENFRWITSPPTRYHVGVDGLSVFL